MMTQRDCRGSMPEMDQIVVRTVLGASVGNRKRIDLLTFRTKCSISQSSRLLEKEVLTKHFAKANILDATS